MQLWLYVTILCLNFKVIANLKARISVLKYPHYQDFNLQFCFDNCTWLWVLRKTWYYHKYDYFETNSYVLKVQLTRIVDILMNQIPIISILKYITTNWSHSALNRRIEIKDYAGNTLATMSYEYTFIISTKTDSTPFNKILSHQTILRVNWCAKHNYYNNIHVRCLWISNKYHHPFKFARLVNF